MRQIIDSVSDNSNLIPRYFGVFGSIAHRFHHTKHSDIDLIIYGKRELEELRNTLTELCRGGLLRNEFEDWPVEMPPRHWNFARGLRGKPWADKLLLEHLHQGYINSKYRVPRLTREVGTVVDEVSSPRLLKQIAEKHLDRYSGNFEARVRYLSSSLIVTIPVKVARELGIKLGDRVMIQVRKKEATPPLIPQGPTSSS